MAAARPRRAGDEADAPSRAGECPGGQRRSDAPHSPRAFADRCRFDPRRGPGRLGGRRGVAGASRWSRDSRRREYALTPAGERVLGELRAAREHALEAVWGRFEPAELERFASFGSALADRLEAYATSAERGA